MEVTLYIAIHWCKTVFPGNLIICVKLYDIQCIFNVLKSLFDKIAITIKTDTNVNPWGFSRKFLDKLAFGDPNSFEKSKKLRTDFKFLTYEIIKVMYGKAYFEKVDKNWTMKDFRGHFDSKSEVGKFYLANLFTALHSKIQK